MLRYFAIALLLIASASAYEIGEISEGQELSSDGKIAVFTVWETEDFNNDGDVLDKIINYYDLSSSQLNNTLVAGTSPTISLKTVAFVDDKGTLSYFELGSDKVTTVQIIASSPYISNGVIAFSSGDTIKYYAVGSQEVVNTKAIGTRPVIVGNKIYFESKESDAGDLNADKDTDDTVIRIFSMTDKKTTTTGIIGSQIALYKDGIVFLGESGIETYTSEGHIALGLKGANPSSYNGMIAYEANGKIAVSGKILDATGKTPKLFEDTIFFADGKIKYLIGEDLDQDGVYDFTDNCPDAMNSDQKDTDKDGKGDTCDEKIVEDAIHAADNTTKTAEKTEKVLPVKEVVVQSERKPLPATSAAIVKTEKSSGMGLLIFAVIVMGIIASAGTYYFISRHEHKKRFVPRRK